MISKNNRKHLIPLFAFMVFAPLVGTASAQDNPDYIVRYRSGASRESRANSVQRAGGLLRHNYSIVDAAAVTVRNPNVLAALQGDPDVLSVFPDHTVFAFQHGNAADDVQANGKPGGGGGTPPPSGDVFPAGVDRIGRPALDAGAGVGVAIVDTGIDLQHRDLAPGTATFSAFGSSCQDNNGHGTHVAGIVAAKMGNQLDVVGVAPGATVYCVKVLDAAGSGSDSQVIAGLDWVYQNHASVTPHIKVVNMSLGRPAEGDGSDALMHDAVATLTAAGIAVVVAAGNDATVDVSTQVPAGFHEVIAVASSTARTGVSACKRHKASIGQDTASYFTTDGHDVTISAPGEEAEDINSGCFISSVGILSLKLGGGTTRMSGTSMAAPHVAGVVARLLQLTATLTPEAVRSQLKSDAVLINRAPYDSETTGYTFDGTREGIVKAPQ
jgi:subtilisin